MLVFAGEILLLGHEQCLLLGDFPRLAPCDSIFVQHSMRRNPDEHHGGGLALDLSRVNFDNSGTLDTRLDYSVHVQWRAPYPNRVCEAPQAADTLLIRDYRDVILQ